MPHTHALEPAGAAPAGALAAGFARPFLPAGGIGIAAFAAAFVVLGRSGRPAPAAVPAPADETRSGAVPSGAAPPSAADH